MKLLHYSCVGLVIVLGYIAIVACGGAPIGQTNSTIFSGVEFPAGEISFADAVVHFIPGTYTDNSHDNPEKAIGPPDYADNNDGSTFVSLGNNGELVVEFTDNSLTPSGSTLDHDLYIFEIGGLVEEMRVYISTDNSTWIYIGDVKGQPTGLDIDSVSGVSPGDKFFFVKIVDLPPYQITNQGFGGADIDAIGAISSAPACTNGQQRTITCGLGACIHDVTETCVSGQWQSTCDPLDGSDTETCNGIDDDCDGTVDESPDGHSIKNRLEYRASTNIYFTIADGQLSGSTIGSGDFQLNLEYQACYNDNAMAAFNDVDGGKAAGFNFGDAVQYDFELRTDGLSPIDYYDAEGTGLTETRGYADWTITGKWGTGDSVRHTILSGDWDDNDTSGDLSDGDYLQINPHAYRSYDGEASPNVNDNEIFDGALLICEMLGYTYRYVDGTDGLLEVNIP